ncbi:Ku protein [Streptomyces sp. AM 4-1-1]|uniref:non-homologous end joining protein Ku n=1 Tax=Streptomyces sp. AM 4-1-1 TaxID=3028710 RepID=UPI0023B94C60|nr:Ku protein [Streptomyces sp. AM 4-1-1]WEH35861.1 Ku protein [Streptomyces sp. AM 4-1-1]
MRSIWNGAISFGLVSIPIKLMNATENHSIHFRQIHVTDGGRVRYRKVCELDGEEVTSAEIGKGYEEADGSVIEITDEDLAALPLHTAKTIEIVAFVPATEIDPLQMDAAYYLSANGATATKPYTLLREALKRSRKVAVAKYALRGRERLGMLRVVDDVIAMHGLLWPDEIRTPEGVAPEADVKVRDAELDLADALMATLGEVDMDSLHDDYRDAVEAMIASKATGEPVEPAAVAETGGGKVIDLLAALEKSVKAAKESHGEDAGPATGDKAGSGTGHDEDADAPVAKVTPITRRKDDEPDRPSKTTGSGSGSRSGSGAGTKKSAASSSKSSGAKKSTEGAGKTAGSRRGADGGATPKKPASRSTAAKKASEKTESAKESSPKKTSAKKSSAKKSSAKKTSAKKSDRASTGGTASRKRASA